MTSLVRFLHSKIIVHLTSICSICIVEFVKITVPQYYRLNYVMKFLQQFELKITVKRARLFNRTSIIIKLKSGDKIFFIIIKYKYKKRGIHT